MLSSSSNEKTTGVSPSSPAIKEGSLSYYFNLHNEGFLSPREASASILCTSSNLNFFPSYPKHQHAKHPSPSACLTQSRPLLDADDDGGAAPLSWLSALFSRRKKPANATRPLHACDEGKCDEPFPTAPLQWEPPRASSWEQLSSWEKPSSSLWNLFSTEPHRASDADMHELRPTIEAQAAAPAFDPLLKKQETSSKGQLQWAKSLFSIHWAIKLRRSLRKKRVAEQGRGDGEDDDRGSRRTSSARELGYAQNAILNGKIKVEQDRGFHSQRELGATWSSHYSPRLKSYGNLKCNNMRGDQGLLRLYLTPTRGIKLGTKRPRSHYRLIPGI